MQKVQNIGHSKPQSFDLGSCQPANGSQNLVLPRRVQTAVQPSPGGALIYRVFVTIWDTQFRLPIKCVCSPLEDLLLLHDRAQDDLQRRASEIISQAIVIDRFDHFLYAVPNRSERFHARRAADKPRVVDRFGIDFISVDQTEKSDMVTVGKDEGR